MYNTITGNKKLKTKQKKNYNHFYQSYKVYRSTPLASKLNTTNVNV